MRDLVREAIYSIDYPIEDVWDWLGVPCGCQERRDKQVLLRQWACWTLNGTLPNPVERLEQIIS